MPKLYCFLLFSLLSFTAHGQQTRIVSEDVPLFWRAFDAAAAEPDTLKKADILRQLYLENGSAGVRAMMNIRHWEPMKFIHSFQRYPAYWTTVRHLTLQAVGHANELELIFQRYQQLYPAFKTPVLYFVMGYGGTGGTTTEHEILIGTEIAAGDSTVNAAGMHPFLQHYFKINKGIMHLVAHEITHTQQPGGDMEDRRNSNLLGFCLAEGVCDFMAELLLQEELQTPYILYGKQHEKELWLKFTKQLHGKDISNWLYNGAVKGELSDLGYYMGYIICKSFYYHHSDKAEAIRQLLSLPYEDTAGLDHFLRLSRYNGKFYK
ncbi:DUF2268 domain-containing putative Zn-dependent protease [Chitinophaga sp. Hz27]|uniref:DUF2268 domain-containing putative Zn-dependent protease n=1 Tax=Chitinophaga sp. Hz27 TaxID=3347169 RepID=UPI0035E285B4